MLARTVCGERGREHESENRSVVYLAILRPYSVTRNKHSWSFHHIRIRHPIIETVVQIFCFKFIILLSKIPLWFNIICYVILQKLFHNHSQKRILWVIINSVQCNNNDFQLALKVIDSYKNILSKIISNNTGSRIFPARAQP